ncbi:uncharacterized protein [Drosophila virilis]|uniref:Uncharacterized protein, isoform B n=1 Tax=Drosophila virilis TaxID=7244 RepID=A0A0Q9WBU1_DROVI|nr:uncharacterized protein LOC6633041 isoform X1 [Drosophila virilis]KRF78820.1 uncharacterized protein Dvir_GJ10847, isoform B [Drosophila virilis]
MANQGNWADANLVQSLNEQKRYINDMENDIQEMQQYYENEVEQSKYNEEVLKCRCNELQQQVLTLQPALKRADQMQMEIDVLRNELRKRDLALNAYDCQYQQLMTVVCEINQKYGNHRGDCPSFNIPDFPEVGDDLILYTSATIKLIVKDMAKQAYWFEQINEDKYFGSQTTNNIEDCITEMDRLRTLLRQKDGQLGNLIEENACMWEAAVESKRRLNQLNNRVRELHRDTKYMEEGMCAGIGLIKDIDKVRGKGTEPSDLQKQKYCKSTDS